MEELWFERWEKTYMRVPHHAAGTMTVKLLHHRAVVGAVACSELLLQTVLALSASRIEGCHDSIAWNDMGHFASDLLDDANTFMAQDLALLELQNFAVVQMQVGSTDYSTAKTVKKKKMLSLGMEWALRK